MMKVFAQITVIQYTQLIRSFCEAFIAHEEVTNVLEPGKIISVRSKKERFRSISHPQTRPKLHNIQ